MEVVSATKSENGDKSCRTEEGSETVPTKMTETQLTFVTKIEFGASSTGDGVGLVVEEMASALVVEEMAQR